MSRFENRIYNKKCVKCGTDFISKGAKALYCKNCLIYNCDFCNTQFQIKRSFINKGTWEHKHYCSPICRWKAQSKMLMGLKGRKNFAWKGGKIKVAGYIRIYKPNYPLSDKKGYILEHRYKMGKKLDRLLKPNEQVHHLNGIKDDNRISNLELVIYNNHFGKIKCPKCHFEFLVK